MICVAAAVALAVFTAGNVLAGEALSPAEIAQHIFTQADTDKDGVLTRSEHESAGLGRYGAEFGDFDLDKDSRVTWDEYKALFDRHHKDLGGRSA